jgi:tetratricopeptide (TPR) repeat protein
MYSRILLEKRDYTSLEVFLLKSYNSFISDNIFDRSNHNDKLTLLTYLSNCFYKTKKYKKSIEFANKLHLSMQEHDSLLYDKYLFYYYNALVLNYSKTDKDKALKFIDQASKNEIITSLPAYSAFIYLNRALIFYYKNNFKEAIKNLSRLTLLEDFLLLDKSFQLKILIVDVMMRWRNQANDILDRISEIKNGYKSILSNVELKREMDFVNIISNSVNSININDLKTQFLTSLSDSESEEIDIISYNSWLRNYLK